MKRCQSLLPAFLVMCEITLAISTHPEASSQYEGRVTLPIPQLRYDRELDSNSSHLKETHHDSRRRVTLPIPQKSYNRELDTAPSLPDPTCQKKVHASTRLKWPICLAMMTDTRSTTRFFIWNWVRLKLGDIGQHNITLSTRSYESFILAVFFSLVAAKMIFQPVQVTLLLPLKAYRVPCCLS